MPPTKYARLLTNCVHTLIVSRTCEKDGIVLVKVTEAGGDRKTYFIHKGLLAYHSKYFAAALRGPWIEAEQETFVLEDVSLEACACNSTLFTD